jgi:hypothetical protein
MRTSLVLILMLGLGGCGGSGDESSSEVTEEGVDVAKNPLGALGALAKAGQDIEKLQEELANMPPTEAVHFSVLVNALPDVPGGWTAEDAHGSTNEMGDYKMSEASRSYSKESSEERVRVEIQDWAFNQAIYIPFLMQARFSQESTEGYSKGIKMGEDPGREEYTTASRSGQRSVLIHKRFHVQVRIDNMDAAAFDEWWPRVKVAELPAASQ